MGYIRIERSKEEMSVEARPLVEYAKEVRVKEYPDDLCQTTGTMITSDN
jgi:hypothetical protein